MNQLFSPYTLGALTLANRIVIPPMCQYSAQDGKAADWHLVHYGSLAQSGAGMLIVEATAVEPEGRISPGDLGLWSESTEIAMKSMISALRGLSPKDAASPLPMPLFVQLAHAGRKAGHACPWQGGSPLSPEEGGWHTFAPSCLPYDAHTPAPAPLDAVGITRITKAFAAAAQRADRAGFDGIEVHAAHGYLLHQFLSPLSNVRNDQYGGFLENRMRLTLEVFTAVREAFPQQKPVGVRISATDWVQGGWTVEDSVQLTQELQKLGCAFIHVSGGGLAPEQSITPGPGYQVAFAARIKAAVGMPTIAVGLITDAEQAETILNSGQADMVAIGRGMLYNPRWGWHAAAQMGAQLAAAPQYLRCAPHKTKNLFTI